MMQSKQSGLAGKNTCTQHDCRSAQHAPPDIVAVHAQSQLPSPNTASRYALAEIRLRRLAESEMRKLDIAQGGEPSRAGGPEVRYAIYVGEWLCVQLAGRLGMPACRWLTAPTGPHSTEWYPQH